MIHLGKSVLQELDTAAGLRRALYTAIRLEHATIPPYLTALCSIKPGRNRRIAEAIQGIVCEEMLHLSLACNLYNALGNRPPRLAHPDFPARYPGPLPGSVHAGLQVGLEPLSLELVRRVFMVIEEPEHPLRIEGTGLDPAELPPDTVTIGEFYERIYAGLAALGGDAFRPGRSLQLDGRQLNWRFGADIFPVHDLESARRAIDVILSQGEGNAVSPIDFDGEPCHFYRFAEVVNGRALVRDPAARAGWSFTGDPIVFEPDGVYPLHPHPSSADYPVGSRVRLLSDQFNRTYTGLLALLQRSFGGEPAAFLQSFGLMSSLRLQAGLLVQLEIAPGVQATPTFEFLPAPG